MRSRRRHRAGWQSTNQEQPIAVFTRCDAPHVEQVCLPTARRRPPLRALSKPARSAVSVNSEGLLPEPRMTVPHRSRRAVAWNTQLPGLLRRRRLSVGWRIAQFGRHYPSVTAPAVRLIACSCNMSRRKFVCYRSRESYSELRHWLNRTTAVITLMVVRANSRRWSLGRRRRIGASALAR